MCITILSFDHPEGTSVDSMRCLDEHLAQGQSSGVGKRMVWRPFHGAAIGVVATGFGVGSPDILVNSGFWNGVPTGVISFPGGITLVAELGEPVVDHGKLGEFRGLWKPHWCSCNVNGG